MKVDGKGQIQRQVKIYREIFLWIEKNSRSKLKTLRKTSIETLPINMSNSFPKRDHKGNYIDIKET